jgi:hypothetical protein
MSTGELQTASTDQLPQPKRRLGSKRALAFTPCTKSAFGSVKADQANGAAMRSNGVPVDHLNGAGRYRLGNTHLRHHTTNKFTEDTNRAAARSGPVSGQAGKRYWLPENSQVGLGVGTVMRLTASQDIRRPFEGASGATA